MERKDSSLFKYRPINLFTLESLRDNYLYFGEPATFNDPFDSILDVCFHGNDEDWETYFKKINLDNKSYENKIKFKTKLENGKDKSSIEYRNTILSDMRILSLSSKGDNILLWSHYADNHKGICIEYRTTELFDENKSLHGLLFDKNHVKYETQTPTPSNLLYAHRVEYEDTFTEKYNLLVRDKSKLSKFIFTKYSDWKYEAEWRIFVPKEVLFSNNCVRLEKNIIKKIIIGMKTSESDVKNIQTFISQNQLSKDIKFAIAKPIPGSYSIKIIDCNSFEEILKEHF